MTNYTGEIMDNPKYFCPYCHMQAAFSWVNETNTGGELSSGFIPSSPFQYFSNNKGIWKIAECPSCDGCVLIKMYMDQQGNIRIGAVYPSPMPSPTDQRMPEKIRKDLDEAKSCLSVNAYRACAGMCRRAMQTACMEKGSSKGDLIDQIDEIHQKGVITVDLKDLAHTVRMVGNDALHPNADEVTPQDAKEILELAEQLMEVIFVAPERVREMKKKQSTSTPRIKPSFTVKPAP